MPKERPIKNFRVEGERPFKAYNPGMPFTSQLDHPRSSSYMPTFASLLLQQQRQSLYLKSQQELQQDRHMISSQLSQPVQQFYHHFHQANLAKRHASFLNPSSFSQPILVPSDLSSSSSSQPILAPSVPNTSSSSQPFVAPTVVSTSSSIQSILVPSVPSVPNTSSSSQPFVAPTVVSTSSSIQSILVPSDLSSSSSSQANFAPSVLSTSSSSQPILALSVLSTISSSKPFSAPSVVSTNSSSQPVLPSSDVNTSSSNEANFHNPARSSESSSNPSEPKGRSAAERSSDSFAQQREQHLNLPRFSGASTSIPHPIFNVNTLRSMTDAALLKQDSISQLGDNPSTKFSRFKSRQPMTSSTVAQFPTAVLRFDQGSPFLRYTSAAASAGGLNLLGMDLTSNGRAGQFPVKLEEVDNFTFDRQKAKAMMLQHSQKLNMAFMNSLASLSAKSANSVFLGNTSMDKATCSVRPGNSSMDKATYSVPLGNSSMDKATCSVPLGNSSMDEVTYSVRPGNSSMDKATYSVRPSNSSMDKATCSVPSGNSSMDKATCSVRPGNSSMSMDKSICSVPLGNSSIDKVTCSAGEESMSDEERNTDDEGRGPSYIEKRRKNNESAKRSRKARRTKEKFLALKVLDLEGVNMRLRVEIALLDKELDELRMRLCQCN